MPKDLDEFLFDHYKQEYQFQRERTDSIRERVSFGVGFLTILGGILIYFASKFPHAWHHGRTLFFYLPFAAAAFFFGVSVLIVLWVVGGKFLYESIPTNPQLQKFCDDLVAWSVASGKPADVVPTVKQSLLIAYREGSHHNFLINRSRTDRLLLANRIIMVAFIFSAAMIPSYIFETEKQEKEPTLVRLVLPGEPKTKSAPHMEETDQPTSPPPATPAAEPAPSAPAAAVEPTQAQSTPAPAKPVFPPNQLLSEGAVRMETKPAPTPTPPEKSE